MSSLARTGHRDTQQVKVYRAERPLHREGRQFATVHHIADYVKRLLHSKWFRAKFGRRYIQVRETSGVRSSNASTENGVKTITINRSMFNELVVLHEIAHHVRPITGKWPREMGAWHGPEFAATLLMLVQHQMGAVVAAKLRASNRAHRVKYLPPRAPLSEERRAALAARLASYRANAAQPPAPEERDPFTTFGGDY